MEPSLADVMTRLDALEEENRSLRALLERPTSESAPPSTGPPEPAPAPSPAVGRRHLIGKGLAAAGAAAAGAVLLDGRPAAAANGDPMIAGQTATATDTTFHIGRFYAYAPSGSADTPLLGLSSSGGGASFLGARYDVRIGPWNNRQPPVFDSSTHTSGELLTDAQANLWYCTGSGRPGTWRTLSGPGCAGSFYPWPAPVRAYDSRPGTQPSVGPKTKLVAGVSRTIDLNAASTVNAGTRGVLVQVLLVNAASGNGNFTIWSDGVPKPQANTLVWGGSGGRWSTLAFTNVASGRVTLNASLATDVVIDVVGIYG